MDKISFIIIGKNQERTIYNCIYSVYANIRVNNLTKYEVLFVDSDSTDKTLDIIKDNFPEVIIVKLKGRLNVAIAKNNGAARSTGNILFFIDGDITLDEKFIGCVLDENRNLKYQLVSGRLEEILYNNRWEEIGFVKDRFTTTVGKGSMELGGIFLIKADLFKSVSGFNEHMKLDEDADLQLRLASKGVLVERIPDRIGIHNTIYYFSYKRLFKKISKGDFLYAGALYRHNLGNRACLRKFAYMQKFTALLITLTAASLLLSPFILLCYPIAILLKYLTTKNKKCSLFEYFLGRLATDLCCIVGFIIFYPGLKKVNYKVIAD